MGELQETVTERRRQTRNNIFMEIYRAESAPSKQEIAAKLGLSMPTVHQNLSELLAAGMIRGGETLRSTGGRRALTYIAAPDFRFAVGISIAADSLRIAALDFCRQEIAFHKVVRPMLREGTADRTAQFIAEELENFLDANKLNRARLLGVGIALPAVINTETDEIKLAPTLHLKGISGRILRDSIPYPNNLENDANAAGYSEWLSLESGGDAAYISLEEGVGGAVLLDGKPFRGMNGRSGEFGHMCVEPGGNRCNCGKLGCLEAYCSAKRISSDLDITIETFFHEIKRGNASYTALWIDFLRHLAIGINNIRMGLDCDVILGGFLAEFLEPDLPELKRMAAELNPVEDTADYIRMCRHPHHAVVLGAALYYLEQYIKTL